MTKGPLLQALWDMLPEARKARIEACTDALEADYLTLQAVRNKAGLTQAQVAHALNVPQSNVSRLEHSADMRLSTLRRYIEAVGGTLTVTVELPNHPPIQLTELGDLIEPSRPEATTADTP